VIEVTQILSLSLVPASVNIVYSSKFLGKENSKIILIDTLLLLASYVVSILIIGSTLGVVGIAIAYVISITIPAIFLIIVDLKNKT
jgi:Na+-driven multidrug efflux pump